MTRLVALDTETTGLDPDTEDVFEVAAVDLASGHEDVWRVPPRDEVVAAMHPKAAEVNQYHYRTSVAGWVWDDVDDALDDIFLWLDGAHIVGAVPDFDARHLASLFRRFGMEPPRWHYHLIDVEAMAVGWLHGCAAGISRESGDEVVGVAPSVVDDLPWRSDDLSRWCGVEPPSDDERHTALGDARWVARLYRHLTGGA